jgi:hypothetical protein
MIAPPAQMISSGSRPAASQKIRFLVIDDNQSSEEPDKSPRKANHAGGFGMSESLFTEHQVVALLVFVAGLFFLLGCIEMQLSFNAGEKSGNDKGYQRGKRSGELQGWLMGKSAGERRRQQ